MKIASRNRYSSAPRLAKVKLDASKAPLDSQSAYLLSLIDGQTTVEGLADITGIPVWRVGHNAGETIAHTAGELQVKHVVIGTSRRTPLWKLLRGSVLRELTQNLREGTQLVVVH